MAKKSSKAAKKAARKVTKKAGKSAKKVVKKVTKAAKKTVKAARTTARKAARPAAPAPASAAAAPSSAASASLPAVGSPAPAFSLPSSQGRTVSLSDYAGKTVVLYFYPKADTPGCTTEACGFRDSFAEYGQRGVEVLGISPDPLDAVTRFAQKYNLPFPLLADEDHKVCEAYGVWVPKSMYGKTYMGAARTTFIIKDGQVAKVFEKVKPDGHEKEVLAAL
ncbi:MAG: thioredoxin-dependent thiol peroxidase [Tepidisphaerales bacterium]